MSPNHYLAAFFEAYPDYAATVEDTGGLGLCREFTEELQAMFAEDLTRVYGHVILQQVDPGERASWPHWWCLDPTGDIVDPTRGQFPGEVEYVMHDPKRPPTGKCFNCGDYCYEGRALCSDVCESEMRGVTFAYHSDTTGLEGPR